MKKLGKLKLKEVKEIITTLSCSEQRNLMGGDVTITFDRSDGMIYIYGGGELQATFNAANNVDSHSQGIWSNGTYSMLDQSSTYTHGSNGGDTFEGTYGINDIYRANNFIDENGCLRAGMGIHAGRSDDYTHPTYGCIRTTEAAMNEIDCLISGYGNFTEITVQD